MSFLKFLPQPPEGVDPKDHWRGGCILAGLIFVALIIGRWLLIGGG